MATWFAVVDGAGNLVSTGTTVADQATLAAAGYGVIQLAGDPTGQIWNASTQTFSPAPPKPTVISVWQFVQRFTPGEFAGIEASNDPMVRQFLLMLQVAKSISPADTVVQSGLQYLVTLGLLTAARVAIVGAS